jgi:hypothetical protein
MATTQQLLGGQPFVLLMYYNFGATTKILLLKVSYRILHRERKFKKKHMQNK